MSHVTSAMRAYTPLSRQSESIWACDATNAPHYVPIIDSSTVYSLPKPRDFKQSHAKARMAARLPFAAYATLMSHGTSQPCEQTTAVKKVATNMEMCGHACHTFYSHNGTPPQCPTGPNSVTSKQSQAKRCMAACLPYAAYATLMSHGTSQPREQTTAVKKVATNMDMRGHACHTFYSHIGTPHQCPTGPNSVTSKQSQAKTCMAACLPFAAYATLMSHGTSQPCEQTNCCHDSRNQYWHVMARLPHTSLQYWILSAVPRRTPHT